MNPRSSKRKVPAAAEGNPQSSSVAKPWFKQVSDSLFHAAVSGSRWRPGAATRETKMPQPISNAQVHRNFQTVRSSVQESRTSLPPPGMDAELLWRKLRKEKHRSRSLQIEVEELKASLETCKKTVTEKSSEIEAKNNEIDSKNKLLNKLIEDKTKIEASIDVIEEEVDIDNLLHANLDLTMKDILDLTDVTFPADLIDLDLPDLDIKDEHIGNVSISPMNLVTSTMTGSQDLEKMIPNREESVQADLGGEKVLPEYKPCCKIGKTFENENVCNFSVNVSPLKLNKEGKQHVVKKRKQVANKNKSSSGSSSSKKRKLSPDAPQIISCPHCAQTYRRGKQWKLMDHLSKSHKTVITYPCQYCDKQFSCQSILQAHILGHQVTHPWHCGKCGYKPEDIRSFLKHVKSVHGVTSLSMARKELLLLKD